MTACESNRTVLPCELSGSSGADALRIAIVSPYAHYAGHHWRTARALSTALRAKGHEVDIITTTAPIESYEVGIATNLFLASKVALPDRLQRILSTSLRHNLETIACSLRLAWLHRQKPYDAWHYVDATHVALFCGALLTPVPLVYHLWGDVSFEPVQTVSFLKSLILQAKRILCERAVRRGKLALVCETEGTRRFNERLFGQHVHRIPFAVSFPQKPYSRERARTVLGISADHLVLLLFGTHREGKDYDTVVRGSVLSGRKVCLLFAGKTISDNHPAVVLKRHGFTDAVVIEKFISNEEAPLYFAACDAVVLPYNEGYTKGSYVLFEAFQYSRPSIATDTGFLKEFIEEYRCGFLFQPGSAQDFARVLNRLATLSPHEQQELHGNIENAARTHSWEIVIDAYVELYRIYSGPRRLL